MKIYLAGSCGSDRRTHMTFIGKELRNEGFEVYCPFELQIPNAWDMSQEEWAAKVFDEDLKAIDAADVVVLMSPGRVSTAGTNWEQGYAYAKNKRVFVFQYTDEATSLMTFCGCTSFVAIGENANHFPDSCAGYVTKWVKHLIENNSTRHVTHTILT